MVEVLQHKVNLFPVLIGQRGKEPCEGLPEIAKANDPKARRQIGERGFGRVCGEPVGTWTPQGHPGRAAAGHRMVARMVGESLRRADRGRKCRGERDRIGFYATLAHTGRDHPAPPALPSYPPARRRRDGGVGTTD